MGLQDIVQKALAEKDFIPEFHSIMEQNRDKIMKMTDECIKLLMFLD